MPKQKFWAVDSSGRVYSLDLGLLTWDEATQNAVGLYKRSFKRISVLDHCAWGVAADQHVYMCMFHTDSPIRVQKTCYENQRWSIFHGWGTKSLFGTDRYSWSSQDGKENLPKASFKLPSGFWSWESDWYIDESIPSDSEGWQYAIDFPATYHKEKGKLSMVRRRKWARYMHFEGFDKWIQIPWDDEKEDRDPLQDIAIGGTEMPCQCPGFLAVWGISFTGKVVFREGIWNLCPEGERWVEIPSQGLNLAQLSVNRIGVVWAVSWDGKIFVRTGVSHKNPKGSGWSLVHPPETGNDPDLKLFQLAAGKKTVWALTRSGKVFFRKGLDPVKAEKDARFLLGSGWVEMVGTMRLISVGPNDQVWGVGMNGNIYVRTHVTKTELVGRKWKQLFGGLGDDNKFQITEKDPDTISIASSTSTDEEIKSDTSSYYGQHWIWISSGACNVDAAFIDNLDKRIVSSGSMASIAHTTRLLRSKWRTKTLSALKKRNMKEVEAASSVFRLMNLGSVHWSKRGKGKLLVDGACNIWKDCHIKLQTDDDNKGGAFLVYFHTDKDQFEEMRIPIREIICVNMVSSNLQFNTFAVHTVEKTFRREPVTLSLENENEFFDWLVCLTYKTCEERLPPSMHRPTSKALWATSISGDVFFCNLPEEHDMIALPLSNMVWQQTGGHMRTVTAGCCGIVYGVGFDGKAYVYSGGHGGSFLKSEHHSMDNIFSQVDYDTCYLYENQRWNPVEGFCDRLLPSDRWPWSDETGVYRFGCESYKLMTSQWKWIDEWEIDHSVPGGADDKGWQYSVDFPRSYHKQKGLHDYVRRRRWKRRCRLATSGPWIEVQSDILLADVSIQTDAQYIVAFSVAVWAVDVKGNVFYRMTVSKEDPKGSVWMHVPAPNKFLSVSVGYRRTVWGLAVDGSAYLRQGFDEDAMIGTHWLHISKRDTGTFSRVSCGECLVVALDTEGILWHRDKTMPAFPEGLEWEKVLEGISALTVGSGDELWIIRKNDIELCVKAENQGLVGCQLVCVLSGSWNSVCIRGCSPEVAEAEECTVEETDVAAAAPQKDKVVPEVNPYKVDIFSFYNRNNPVSLSIESEEDMDIEIVGKEDSIA